MVSFAACFFRIICGSFVGKLSCRYRVEMCFKAITANKMPNASDLHDDFKSWNQWISKY